MFNKAVALFEPVVEPANVNLILLGRPCGRTHPQITSVSSSHPRYLRSVIKAGEVRL